MNNVSVDDKAMNDFFIVIKLHINQKLFEKGYITEEMFIRAKDMIIRS